MCRYSFAKENNIPTNNSIEFHQETNTVLKADSNFPYAILGASVVYFVLIYFMICTLSGAIVGAIAGAQNPANASLAGASASFFCTAIHVLSICSGIYYYRTWHLGEMVTFYQKVVLNVISQELNQWDGIY